MMLPSYTCQLLDLAAVCGGFGSFGQLYRQQARGGGGRGGRGGERERER